jgi:hypothetical protein
MLDGWVIQSEEIKRETQSKGKKEIEKNYVSESVILFY